MTPLRGISSLLAMTVALILVAGCGTTLKSQIGAADAERQLEGISRVVSISDLLEFPPTVVELTSNSARVRMVTNVPTTCAIAYGLTTEYGEISTDDSMMRGGHSVHSHTIRGLRPDTVYYYKWGLLGRDGTVYASKDLAFQTQPEE